MNTKVLAFLVAALMFSVAGISFLNVTEDSDGLGSETGQGSFNIYSIDGENKSFVSNVFAYNGLIAINNTEYSNNLYLDQRYYVIQNGFNNSNADYGKILPMGEGVWNAFVYTDADENGAYEWVLADKGLGWYKPYADYIPAYTTANIALYKSASAIVSGTEAFNNAVTAINNYTGSTQTIIADNVESSVSVPVESDITQITTGIDSPFKVTFYVNAPREYASSLQVSGTSISKANIVSGVEISGYGSDCFTAFCNAVGAGNVAASMNNPIPGYEGYSWITTIFGLGTQQTGGQNTPEWNDDVYHYWTICTDIVKDNEGNYQNAPLADFNIGAYSPIMGAPLTTEDMSIVYSDRIA